MGRNASGVRGISLANETDEVIGMIAVDDMEVIFLLFLKMVMVNDLV